MACNTYTVITVYIGLVSIIFVIILKLCSNLILQPDCVAVVHAF